MRHDLGREQLHAAHHLAVRHAPAGIEPADHPAHAKLFVQRLQALNAGLGRFKDAHHLGDLVVGHPSHPLQDLFDATGFGPQTVTLRGVDGGDRLQETPDARLQLFADLSLAVGHVQRAEQGNIFGPRLGVTGRSPCLVVDRNQFAHFRKRIHLRGDKDGIAQTSHQLEGVQAVGRRPDGWVGLLDRLGNDRDIVHAVELSVKRHPFRGPGLTDHVERLHHPPPALFLVDTKTAEVGGDGAAPNPKLDPAVADHIQNGNFLSHP